MPTYSAKTCILLHIATNCNVVVFMTVCIYRYIHTTALYYSKYCLKLSLVLKEQKKQYPQVKALW